MTRGVIWLLSDTSYSANSSDFTLELLQYNALTVDLWYWSKLKIIKLSQWHCKSGYCTKNSSHDFSLNRFLLEEVAITNWGTIDWLGEVTEDRRDLPHLKRLIPYTRRLRRADKIISIILFVPRILPCTVVPLPVSVSEGQRRTREAEESGLRQRGEIK